MVGGVSYKGEAGMDVTINSLGYVPNESSLLCLKYSSITLIRKINKLNTFNLKRP